ncbi:peroxisome proliferator-activated receptor gamma coactivator-related protein like protein [Tanacetum coccineum]
MTRLLFNWIVDEVNNHSSFFRDNIDCTGKEGISAMLKCASAIRQLAYDINADFLDEYLQMTSRRKARVSRDVSCPYAFKGQMLGAVAKARFVTHHLVYPWGYYLVNGIYPELVTLVKTISEPTDDDNKRILYKL